MRTLCWTLLLLSPVACAREPVIERARVERVLATLAADSMEGRGAFTPGAVRAARFISAEFERIGLEPLEGLSDYLQAFPVFTFTLDRVAVTLNGRRVPPERVAVSMAADSVRWNETDAIPVVAVGAGENLGVALSQVEGNAIVLLHPSFAPVFERLRARRTARTLDRSGGTARVYVLTDQSAARSYAIYGAATVEEMEIANVVGMIPGRRADEYVLFSAHYDHIGIVGAQNGDSIANGANDDASGTTAVIELARYYKAKRRPERTLVFAAFTAEEAGGYGSRYFSQQLAPEHIVAMFNIEMIGKPATEGPNTAWITGWDKSDFGVILQRAVEGTEFSFGQDPYPSENLFLRSDNRTLARLGVPAHSISTTPIDVDQDYHRVTDDVATLDLEHMTNTIRGLARGAAPIVSGQATPSRVVW